MERRPRAVSGQTLQATDEAQAQDGFDRKTGCLEGCETDLGGGTMAQPPSNLPFKWSFRKKKHKLRRRPKKFDKRREKEFIAEIAEVYSSNNQFFETIRFSIIMPICNREDTLQKAIQSVLDQSHRNFELIIVDDGSSDNSYALAREFKDERIRLFRSEHRASSAQRAIRVSVRRPGK